MMERTIRVTGKGKLSVKPDIIRLRINIEGMYEEYDETLRKSSDCVEILKDLIEKLGYERKELKSQLLMEVRADIESSFSIIKQQVSELIQKGEFSFEILSIRLGRHTKEINLRTAFEYLNIK